ncbi:UNVERIFIED_CONTAM: hypothetical protein GTU68_009440 [Idotea baltica]|nr:hypothetical protein [Idotea baltica]
MPLTISQVLNGDQLSLLNGYLDTLDWIDGAKSAGTVAAQVKRNLQADLTSPIGKKVQRLLTAAVHEHPVLRAAAQPKTFSDILVSKTGPGNGYGLHVDNAYIRKGAGEMRTDLSFTLFLTSPDEYEGGALSIEKAGTTQQFKPDAGDLVLYPSTHLHEVQTVTTGNRLVCVGWIESKIRNESDREIMFDLENLKANLRETYEPQSIEMLTVYKIFSNLLRRLS